MLSRTRALIPLPMFLLFVLLLHLPASHAIDTKQQNPYIRTLTGETKPPTKIFEEDAWCVVYINTFGEKLNPLTLDMKEVPLGTGSGFIWDKEGHVVTNYHVLQNSNAAEITILSPKQSQSSSNPQDPDAVIEYTRNVYKAKVVGIDPAKDVAVFKITTEEQLHPINIGSSSHLKVGQAAYAIGNPFGLDHSMSSGIVSGLRRQIQSPSRRIIANVIQTDAAVNPGNSGGPLLDAKGEIIGMNTSILSTSGASAGIGFAIPIDDIKKSVDILIKDGKITHAGLGVTIMSANAVKSQLGLEEGVIVLQVSPLSPSKEAGLKGSKYIDEGLTEVGDIIVKLDDKVISTDTDLITTLDDYKPGQEVKLTVERIEEWSEGKISKTNTVEIMTKTVALGDTGDPVDVDKS